MATSIVFKRSTQQVSCDLNGEAAILHLDQSVYFGLSGVGAEVWAALEQPQSVAELTLIVCNKFAVEPERCERDLMKFLSQLQAAGLAEAVEN